VGQAGCSHDRASIDRNLYRSLLKKFGSVLLTGAGVVVGVNDDDGLARAVAYDLIDPVSGYNLLRVKPTGAAAPSGAARGPRPREGGEGRTERPCVRVSKTPRVEVSKMM